MMSKKISIIVPVYNVEKYLERCVESLVNQTYQNIEIILVDDKSPDSSGALCDELAKKDERIRVFHKEKNEGLGFARNTGIENACGDYIMFIDSDDYFDLKACEISKEKLEKADADICCFMPIDVYRDYSVESSFVENDILYENERIADGFLTRCIASNETEEDKAIGISACMALYKASLFENASLRFVSERDFVNEDLIFRIELCRYIKKALVIKDNLYFYFHNCGTLTTSYKENRFEESCKMFAKVDEMTEPFNCPELHKRNIRYFMLNTMVTIKQEVKQFNLSSLKTIREICKNEMLCGALRQYPISRMPLSYRLFFNGLKSKNTLFVYLLVKTKLLIEKNKIS
ncbi:MAG: glycosyltransferase family 2 protein [Eubacterium sp.]|nr:glycosyltransferase family 2 protein [Eubacterium sp.]